jgi:hypothetical protein
MNTYFGLLAQFGAAEIPLEQCCALIGLTPDEAKRRASRAQLPFPCYRAGSQKAPWMVDAAVLAKYLDEQKAKGKDEWERLRGAA